jgi:hypothetical protein
MSDRYRIFSGINGYVVRDQEEGKFVSWHKSIGAAKLHVDSLNMQAAGFVRVDGIWEPRPRTKEELAAEEDAAYERALISKHAARDSTRANGAQRAIYDRERAEPKVQRAKAGTAVNRERAANEAQLALYAKERTAREAVERARVSEQTSRLNALDEKANVQRSWLPGSWCSTPDRLRVASAIQNGSRQRTPTVPNSRPIESLTGFL